MNNENNISEQITNDRLGTIQLTPQGPVVAGSMMEWKITYTAGSYGVDEGGVLMLIQRIAADIEKPQFEHPKASAYTTIYTNAECRLSYRFQPKQHSRPWQKWCLVIDIQDGYLSPGDTITIILGDRSQGSPGIRAQSFVESSHEFRVLVDPTNAAMPRRLPTSPVFPVVAGEATSIVCKVPSQMLVGESNDVFVIGEDRWGNPTDVSGDLDIHISGEGQVLLDQHTITGELPGKLYVHARSSDMKCRSNPLEVVKSSAKYKKYWGDLHAQTDSTVGTGSEDEYFTFAREKANLDFVGHQGNDFQVTDEDWSRLNQVIKHHNTPGDFIVFPGYEWSGNSSAGGDHNVIYLNDDQPILRSSHWQVPEVPETELSPAHPLNNLLAKLKNGDEVMVIPHVGGRPADVSTYFDPELEHVVEIISCHGMFEWLLWDALELGYKVGVVCNSDGHKGRPGAEGPGAGMFGIAGGLTCIFAEELTREALFKALKARRCYGTTGARMILDFEADGHLMGEEISTENPLLLKASVKGSAPIESISLMNGKQVVETRRPNAFDDLNSSKRIRISWGGARIRGRARRATWDGEIELTGTSIRKATTFSFDSPADGIITQTESGLKFKSTTAGDVDGIDLLLSSTAEGTIIFKSEIGNVEVDLSELANEPVRFDFGGLDLNVTILRYPEELTTESLSLEIEVELERSQTNPYLIKAVQEDGHIAWSSPIFVTRS